MQILGKSRFNSLIFCFFSNSNLLKASLSGNNGLCCSIFFNSAAAFMASFSFGSMAKSVKRSQM